MTLAVCIIDTQNHTQAAHVMQHTIQVMSHCHPATQAYWISDQPPPINYPIPVQFVQIPTITNFPYDYNKICLHLVPEIIQEDHVLIIQTDGYPVNLDAWSAHFLDYDYIGAVMSEQWVPRAYGVGNGGFSLRSQKLLAALREIQADPGLQHEDTTICWRNRHLLEDQYAIKFAPHDLADQFSIEYNLNSEWTGKSFGFHGKHIQYLYAMKPLQDHPASSSHTLSVVCIDTRDHADAAMAVTRTINCLHFVKQVNCVHWFSNMPFPSQLCVPVIWHPISPIVNYPRDYNKITLELLVTVIQEDHFLLIQADGYAVNSSAWSDEFLQYDYVGSPFNVNLVPDAKFAVGNGGFSLRSKKLLQALQHLGTVASDRSEDILICWDLRQPLEDIYQLKFAPLNVAYQFGIELPDNFTNGPTPPLPWLGKSLGFHGRHPLASVYYTNQYESASDSFQGAPKVKIAVYTIALNEEKYVDTWFNSVKEADYWLVADTGSTDATVSKLRALGVKCEVIHVRPWRFDLARNIALSLIPSDIDICISMDMDEHMAPGWRSVLEQAWQPGTTRVRHTYHTYYGASEQPTNNYMADKIHARIGYTWKRPVHETVFALDAEHVVTVPELVQKHIPDSQKARSQYLPLLQMSHAENPTCAQTLFWLAREHAHMGETEPAAIHFLKLLTMEHVWHLEQSEAERWLAKLQPHRALEWLRRSVATAPERREGWRDLAQYYYSHAQWANCYAACVEAMNITSGTGTYLDMQDVWGAHVYDLAAISSWNLGLKEQSEPYASQALQLSPQDVRLQNNLKLIQQTLGKV